jgi:hypothetical protein
MPSRDEKIKLLLALDEKDRRKTREPMIQYKPHAAQQLVHDNAEEHRIHVLTAGNRFGKSFAGAAEFHARRLGYRPWEVPGLRLLPNGMYPPRSSIHPSHWLRRPDGVPLRQPIRALIVTGLAFQKGIGLIVWPAIEAMMTPAERKHPKLRVSRNSQGVPQWARLPDGTEIFFASGQQSPKELEGGHFDWIWCDEPPPAAFWVPMWRGATDLNARVLFTMTAITDDSPWVEDLTLSEKHDVSHQQGSIYDNPYISDQAKEEFVNELQTDEDRVARIHGGWAHRTHQAFLFDPAAHVMAPFKIPASWPRTMSCDPAHRRPYAMVWKAWGPNDDVYLYNEWPHFLHHEQRSSDFSVRDYATIIRQEEGNRPVLDRALDPRFGVAETKLHGVDQDSLVDLFYEQGITFETDIPGTAREETGIQLIRDYLKWDTNSPLSDLNRPRLRIFAPCQNSILALQKSIYVPPNHKDRVVLPEKLRENFKDFRDAIRYGLLNGRPPVYSQSQARDGYISAKDLAAYNNTEL